MGAVRTDDDLVKLGFAHVDDSVFLAPPSADLRFLPCGRYYEIRIAIGDGNIISVVCLSLNLTGLVEQ